MDASSNGHNKNIRRGRVAVPAMLGLVAIAALAVFVWQIMIEETETIRNETETVCENLANSISLHIAGDADYFSMMAGHFSSHGYDPNEFVRFASRYVDTHPGLVHISWVDPSFTIVQAEPHEGSKNIAGLKVVGEEPVRVSRLAVTSRRPMFTGPFELVEGDTGIILFNPVFDNDGRFIGIVNGVYSLDAMVHNAVPESVKEKFHIEIVDKGGKPVTVSDVLEDFDPSGMAEHLLDPPGNGLKLRLYPYKRGAFGPWGAPILGLVALLVGGMAWGWYSRNRLYESLEKTRLELQRAKDRYQSIFEDSPVAITVNDFSPIAGLRDRLRAEGVDDFRAYSKAHPEELKQALSSITRLDANPNAIDLYGAPDRETLTVSDGIGRNFTEGTAASLTDPILRFMEGETSASVETELVRSDGRRMFAHVTSTVVPGSEHNLSSVITCIIDVTATKEAERELRNSERKLKAIMDNIPDRAWLKAADGTLIEANEPYLSACGLTRDELAGKTDLDLWPEPLANFFMDSDRQVVESGERTMFEELIRDKDGRERWFKTIKTPIFDDDGIVTGTAGIAHEVTDQKLLEIQRTELHAMISHDIRTPLTLIAGNVDLIEKKYPDDPTLATITAALRRSAEKISGMFEDFVALSRLESANMILNRMPADISALTRDICSEFEDASRKKSLKLSFSTEAGIPRVYIDASYTQRAISNLVQNAVNYTPREGSINVMCYVEAGKDGGSAVVEVSDTGPGIPAPEHDKVFEKYYRFAGTSSGTKGSGLGLAIVKAVAEAHGGYVTLDDGPDGGSVFRLVLPLGRPDVRPAGSDPDTP